MRTLFLTLLLAVPAAHADTTLVYHDGDGRLSYQVRITADGVRFDHREASDGVLLFDLKGKRMIALDTDAREYMVFDEATIASLRAQIEQAKRMAEQMGLKLDDLGIEDTPESVEVSTGETKTVNGFKCTVHRVQVGDAYDGSACLATPGDIGMPAADWNALMGMYKVMTDIGSDMLGSELDFTPSSGIPVESAEEDGSDREVLVKVDRAAIDASVFEVPAGYRRVSLDR